MAQQWVDAFFATGELRLSTYKSLRALPDERFGDMDEGNFMVELQGQTLSGAVIGSVADSAYVLCGCSRQPSPEQLAKFGEVGIQIFHPEYFAKEVARCIPGFLQGYDGGCYYSTGGIPVQVSDQELQEVAARAKSGVAAGMPSMMKLTGPVPAKFFLKRQRFADEAEYRLVWLVHDEAIEPRSFYAPGARQYCRPWRKR